MDTSNPLGNRNLNDTDVDGLIAWEEKNEFVKAEINPFIDIVKTLKRNRIHRVYRYEEICNDVNLMKSGWLDHWCIYTDKSGRKIFTSCPYADRIHNTEQIKAVTEFCRKNGLSLKIIDGFYSPGCIMYVIYCVSYVFKLRQLRCEKAYQESGLKDKYDDTLTYLIKKGMAE